MRLRSTWYDAWSPEIDSALSALPASSMCPPGLYATLLERSLAEGGRAAVVEDGNGPVAVVGLEREGRLRWRNLTNWLIPGFICPSADGMALEAIASLDAEISVAWWGMPEAARHPAIRESHDKPTSRLVVAEREAFWRSSKMWRTIVNARNRCSELGLRIDEPGDAEWTIRSWAAKWATPEEPRPEASADAQIEIARRLTAAGRLVTLVLHDDGRPLAGSTNFIDGDTITAGVLYRDESVGSLPTGVRIIDELFEYATRHGIREIDLGGGHAYKSRWAPTVGADYDLVLAPTLRHLAHSAVRTVTRRH
ncbi:GNAT family N-acetyltransferase [Microbacterium ulmi]|uniref:GNAT family N-acetyltransferase n=1 Tax=Microbacterium ulmi TaxID=179095 RepID=A0A7Y2Q143_9MICO|nr:GNAT family N-acetyltransferase [Microbacterium ulmi]NII69743.1 hypothetical protein [Microbacterium ulmi]NNH03283.1 GNAT family N-acetyltransferase [Microbacterium ulmi]